jgi:hypothetical protein
MSTVGFTDINGKRVRFADIDPIRDAARFNASPATVAHLINDVVDRAAEGIDFSASQLSTTTRQHLLRAISDNYPTTGKAMAAHLGVMKHEKVNVQQPGLIVEERFTSKRDPRLSGRIDHAAIVDTDDDGTLVVDLYDLKTTKWYSTTLIAKDVWEHHPDYAWQLNLCAVMMEENGIECPDCGGYGRRWFDRYDGFTITEDEEPCVRCSTSGMVPIRVRNLFLECIPADSSYNHEAEARKLGFAEWQKVVVRVDRRSADDVYRTYQDAIAERDRAIADGWAPICAERWSNRKVQNVRCKFYCDVAAECVAFSKARGEAHPLVAASTDETLTADLSRSVAAVEGATTP